MKKIFLLLAACVCFGSVFAEGYQVNVLSTRQTGMGHVGTGMKLGAESMHFNPAGLAFLKQTFDFSAGLSFIKSDVKFRNGDYIAKTNNSISTPLYVYAGFKIYDNFSAGIALTTPYGSSLDWGRNWKGAGLIQDIALKSYVVQPTFAYKITDRLSVGVGFSLAIGQVKLSRAMMSADEFQLLGGMVGKLPNLPDAEKQAVTGMISKLEGSVPVSATLDGKTKVRAGFNVGVMYDVCDKVTLGLSYRSKLLMKVDAGKATVDYASLQVEQMFGALSAATRGKVTIPPLNEGTFKAELPLPSNLTFGVSYRPTDRWNVAFDLQYVGWSAYDSLNVMFTPNVLNGYSINSEKDYKNTVIARIGAQYKTTERLDLRAGIYFDQSPICKDNFNPETPGMNKLGTSVGLSFVPLKHLVIDLSFLYIHGLGCNGSYSMKNMITNMDETFGGKYTSNACTTSLGVAYRF